MRARAMESGQLSAAVAAIKEKGVLSGQRIERREIGAPGEFDALSDDELERAVRERFNALGLTPDAGSDRLKLIDGLWGLQRQAVSGFLAVGLRFRSGHTSRCERNPGGAVAQFRVLEPALVSGIVQS